MYRRGQWLPDNQSRDIFYVAQIKRVYRLPFGTFIDYEAGYTHYDPVDDFEDFDPQEGGIVDLATFEEVADEVESFAREALQRAAEDPRDEIGRPLLEKTCQGCRQTVMLPAEYGFCNTCADIIERGGDPGGY